MKVTGSAGAGLLGASVVSSGCVLPPNRRAETNVVVEILRKDHISAHGNPWIRTPNLDSLAKEESLRFTRAYPESLPCYQTTFVTDTMHQFKASNNFHRGFDVFDFIRGQTRDRYRPDWTLVWEKMKRTMVTVRGSMRQYSANTATRETEEDWFVPQVFTRSSALLETASGAQPFFMVVDCYDPHEPWDPPQRYIDLYDGGEPYTPREGSSDYLTERQLKRMRPMYAAEVTMVDRWLGRFLEKIDELGLFENTLIILLSDHGHALGEHKIVGKPVQALWPELTDIVFLIRHPEGMGAGQTSDISAATTVPKRSSTTAEQIPR